jgi:hypothetical protein
MQRQALKRALVRTYQVVSGVAGMDPFQLGRAARNLPRFLREMQRYQAGARGGAFEVKLGSLFPILSEYGEAAGAAGGHYFHQDLWAARQIYQRRPVRHVDVGSRMDGFIAHLLTFMPVTVIDVRALDAQISGLTFTQADATNLVGIESNSIDSLSSLHAVEHFGLGRYGDPVDAQACFAGMAALARVLKPGGHLYFGVPIGRERVEFNAHRVFAPETVLRAFSALELVSFAAVDDKGAFDGTCKPADYAGAFFACGLFELRKPG